MSPVLRTPRPTSAASNSRSAARTGHLVLPGTPVPARAHPCPGTPGMAQIVVLDGTAVPTPEHFRIWSTTLVDHGFIRIRTGALAPRQAAQAERAGLVCVQVLALLDVDAPFQTGSGTSGAQRSPRTKRLREGHLDTAAVVDTAAFGHNWALDASMLADIRHATPSHRARIVTVDDRIVGFLVSGRAGRTGYVQRLAVDPQFHRQGLATALVDDAMRWMRRNRVTRAFVNTHVDNDAALELYRRHGFGEMPERLRVYEGPVVT